ncbi:hypothetical protein LCGC14_0434040 [marine sediment metagenome]|uniref:Uncharacterized protein n=1 Tax=marine sediment metagenome TaxID=412755 RepID=A0A0F9STG0_9ZZZZ
MLLVGVGLFFAGAGWEYKKHTCVVPETAINYDSNDWPVPSLEQIQQRCGVKPDGIYGDITKIGWNYVLFNQSAAKYFKD